MPWDDHHYRVVSNEPVTPVIRELWTEPVSTPLPFVPGQYVLLSDVTYRVPPRSYSVANAPRPDGRVSLLVTLVADGPTSTWVHEDVQVGDEVLLSGPYGTFVLSPDASGPVLLLAAGSGLAPARALAEAVLGAQPSRPVTLVFSARTWFDTIDHRRFLEWERARPDFRYVLTLTRDPDARWHARIPELLPDIVGTLRGSEVFASGPPGFVAGCLEAAVLLGADRAAVHTEEFFADPRPWTGSSPPTESSEP